MKKFKTVSEKRTNIFWPVYLLTLLLLVAWGIGTVSPEYSRMLFIVIVLLALFPVMRTALKKMMGSQIFTIETLMSTASLGALMIDATAEAAVVLWLFHVGESLETYATQRARSGISSLMSLVPEKAMLLLNGRYREVNVSELRPGDVIEVSPGGRLPTDAVLLESAAAFDESALTGESLPVERKPNEIILAGSLVVDRVCRIRVTSEPGANAIDRILRLIDEADAHKSPTERFLDTFSRYYTPVIALMSILVMVVPPLFFAQPWDSWVYRGLALMLIGCPCALVISTPAAITSGLAAAARKGILVKGGAALEQLAKIRNIAMDKTGTLTEGRPTVVSVFCARFVDEAQVLRMAAGVESGSTHPLAKAIVQRADELSQSYPLAENRQALPGMGIQGEIDGMTIKVLSPTFALLIDSETDWSQEVARQEAEGYTVVVVLKQNIPQGIITLRDTLRSDAIPAMQALRDMGINCVMLTGDNSRAAAVIADQLNMQYQARLLPQHKVSAIYQMQKDSPTAMLGDGINDAPAMRAAGAGISMGSGTDVALETADVALTKNKLIGVPLVIEIARRTRTVIRQNVGFSVGLKLVFLLTSVLGFTGLWVAIMADSGATVLVVFNALRLLKSPDKSRVRSVNSPKEMV
ncbi:heavy metal translocating P-type ATPase [Serratia quinivorans]|uniref:heavy metal translocating P-type ATPase n=1 Tax=Serratia quinivorans TaxID=137545 RepID=UPI0034C6C7E5